MSLNNARVDPQLFHLVNLKPYENTLVLQHNLIKLMCQRSLYSWMQFHSTRCLARRSACCISKCPTLAYSDQHTNSRFWQNLLLRRNKIEGQNSIHMRIIGCVIALGSSLNFWNCSWTNPASIPFAPASDIWPRYLATTNIHPTFSLIFFELFLSRQHHC